uniref:RING-type E3 ubiquitin transferase n=2 Tax=Brassica oleracea var. oleracea TaxID=109376 RepID=A0A0D3CKL6_BRAOL
MLCGSLRNRVRNWLRDYVRLQSVVVILIYAQIGCAMVGSLGALYNGVLLINLAIALFALVAIESNSQSLGRTYAVLLFCAILLDISWLILFSSEIWNISSEMYKALYIFSVKLTMAMEIAGFVVRLSSSLLWFQIYRLGASIVDTSLPRRSDSDSQNSFVDPPCLGSQRSRDPDLRTSLLEPSTTAEHRSRSDDFLEDSINGPRSHEILEDSIDGPAYQFPPFDGGQNNLSSPKATHVFRVMKHHSAENIFGGSQLSAAEASRHKSPLSKSLESLDSSLHRFKRWFSQVSDSRIRNQGLAMEDANAIRYWCHMCSRSVNPVIEGEVINCNFCQSGFVEEMDETPDQATGDHPHQAVAESLWAPILLGVMNDHDQNQRASESNVENEDGNNDDDDDDDGQINDGEFDLERHLEEVMRRRRRHSAAILDLLQGIRAGLSVESENNDDNNQDNELVVLINSFNQRIRIQDSVDASAVPSGSLGDYFIGPGFEMLLQRLAENDPNNRYGTPPATKEAVESLETVMVEEGLVQCTVCLDDFEIGVEAKEMPCKHKFHSECLLPWLELHSSCPVCRYLLPTGDDDGETKTDAETSSNVSMENNGTSVDSSSNNPSVND